MRTQAEQLLGARVTSSDGKLIGTVEQIFRDDVDGTPAWARVRSGKSSRFVPLGTSQVTGEGLRVPFDSPTFMNSPDIEAGQHMSAAQCAELSRFYGLTIPTQQAPGEQAPGRPAPSQQVPRQETGAPRVSGQQIPGQETGAPRVSGQQVPGQQVPGQQAPSQQGTGMPTEQDAAYGRTTVRAEQLLGARVACSDGKVIGTIEQVFRDDVDGTPAWARVRSGKSSRFVPLGTSQVSGEGLRVPIDSPTVMNSPDIDAGLHISAAQAEELSRFYGLTIPPQQPPA